MADNIYGDYDIDSDRTNSPYIVKRVKPIQTDETKKVATAVPIPNIFGEDPNVPERIVRRIDLEEANRIQTELEKKERVLAQIDIDKRLIKETQGKIELNRKNNRRYIAESILGGTFMGATGYLMGISDLTFDKYLFGSMSCAGALMSSVRIYDIFKLDKKNVEDKNQLKEYQGSLKYWGNLR